MKAYISVVVLTSLCVIGMIILGVKGQDYSLLVPIIAALVGWLVGNKNDTIVGFIRRKK